MKFNATLAKKHRKDTPKDNLVLIIDDEERICRELSEILEDNNYRVLCAHSGNQARQTITKTPVDLVLLDLKLPDVNGLDLIKDIRKASRDVHIIIITGYG